VRVCCRNREQRDLSPGALEMMILRTLKGQPRHGRALAQHPVSWLPPRAVGGKHQPGEH